MDDPYKTLGVSHSTLQDEIKKAYRKLAKKYHPDLNPGNKDLEKKFKEIAHAFDLIGTADARAKYDRGEIDDQQQGSNPFQNHRSNHQRFYRTQENGGRYASSFSHDFESEDLFESLFGRSSSKERSNQDQLYKLDIEFREAALGGEKVIPLPNGKKIQIKIPAGIEEGKKLKFKGLADNGDVYVQITIRPDANFSRAGMDILSDVSVSFFEAITGADIPVKTLEGSVMLTISPGSVNGSKLRIKHKGAGTPENRGNHIVTLKVVMPKDISPEMRSAISDLKKRFDYNPRAL